MSKKLLNGKMIAILAATLALFMAAGVAEEGTARPVSGDYEYALDGENAILTRYLGEQKVVALPASIDGHPVAGISPFWGNNGLRVNAIEAYEVDAGHPAFSTQQGVLFDQTGRTLLHYPLARGDKRYRVPDGVETIAHDAFCGTDVERIDLPAGVREIGDRAFDNSGLSQINLPEGLVSIGDDAFGRFLTRITLPQSLAHIGAQQFNPDFQELKIAKGNAALEIRDGALINWPEKTLVRYLPYANGTEYTVPQGIEAIEKHAFVGNRTLQRITLPEGVTSVGDYALAYCKELTDVALPEGLISIGNGTFADTYGIRYLEIPHSVTFIGSRAFYSTASLTPLVHEGSCAEQYMRENAEKQGRIYAVFAR